MDHIDHLKLIRDGVHEPNGVWADLGSGGGAFTLALADLVTDQAQIYTIDRDRNVLNKQHDAMRREFPTRNVTYQTADFTQKLDLPPLDGLIMANSLHFVRNKPPVLELVRGYLKPGGHLIIVEYNTDKANDWVPFPFSYEKWVVMANKNGFKDTRQLHMRSSRFLDAIYSAVSIPV